MKHPLLVLVFVLVSTLGRSAPSQSMVSVQQKALKLLDLLQQQQIPKALQLAVSYPEWRSFSKRGLHAQQHKQKLTDFFESLAREFQRGRRVEQLELKDVLIFPAGGKRSRSLVMAVFHAGLSSPERSHKPFVLPLLFVEVSGEWKFMVRS